MNIRFAALLVATALVLVACSDDDGSSAPPDDPAQFAADNLAEAARRGAADEAAPSSTTTTEPAPLDPTEIPGEPVNQYSLVTGDCFDQLEDRRDGLPVTITTRISCDEPHHFQVFAQLTYPAEHPSIYPGDAAVRDYALQRCYREFTPWVGSEYELSDLGIGVIIPNQENFESNAARYRGIHCWADRTDGEPMIGTSRDSGW